jgi:type 1 fimbriae regulatory protein FimB/type 1 fimbriae regulatory protein FimE
MSEQKPETDIWRLLSYSEASELSFPVHPHMLRHSCGFYMADRREDVRVMQDWLGRANVQNTVRYTTLAPGRLDNARAPG